MAALILLDDGVAQQASGALFDWTLEFLTERITDPLAVDRLRQIVDNNLGSLWFTELAPAVRSAALEHLVRSSRTPRTRPRACG
jgi:hypothetical protein